MVWLCIFCCECAKLGHFGRSRIKLLQAGLLKVRHNTTHKTQKNTQQQNEPSSPYPPSALPSLSMGRSAVPPNHGASYRLMEGACHRVWWRHGWFVYWGHQKETERCAGLWPEVAAVWGYKATINLESATAAGWMLERRHAGWGACGGTPSHCLGRRTERCKNNRNTKHGGIYWPPIGRPKQNNQPKTGSHDGGEHGGDMQRAGHMEEALCHHFGGVVCWIGGKKLKKILSLVTNFFSAGQPN